MRYGIRHITSYSYSDAVAVSHNLAHLAPRDDARQRRTAWKLTVLPEPGVQHRSLDTFGNQVDRFVVQEPHRSLVVTAESEIEITPREPFDQPGPAWESLAHDNVPLAVEEFRYESPLVPRSLKLAAYAETVFTKGRDVLEASVALNRLIFKDFIYDPKATTISTPIHEVLDRRRGVCQDFAQLLCGCLRSLNLPARYVSGYLETLPPPGKARLIGADASHAWTQVWCGSELGWIDLDPTNGIIPDDRHVTVALGRDFSDVSPLIGMILGGGSARIRVSVDVERLGSRPDPET